MPGPIKRYRKDPQGKGRGPGLYYHRGRGIYSKYSGKADKKVGSKRYAGKGDYRHTNDRIKIKGKGSNAWRRTGNKKKGRKPKR